MREIDGDRDDVTDDDVVPVCDADVDSDADDVALRVSDWLGLAVPLGDGTCEPLDDKLADCVWLGVSVTLAVPDSLAVALEVPLALSVPVALRDPVWDGERDDVSDDDMDWEGDIVKDADTDAVLL